MGLTLTLLGTVTNNVLDLERDDPTNGGKNTQRKKERNNHTMCLRLVEMYIYRSKPTRNYSFVLLCVGAQGCRKSMGNVSSAVNATAPHDYYWSAVSQAASVFASISQQLVLRGTSLPYESRLTHKHHLAAHTGVRGCPWRPGTHITHWHTSRALTVELNKFSICVKSKELRLLFLMS